MRTFAEKPNATQRATSPKATVRTRSHFGHSHEVNSILHLQRTIGNQAVQTLLRGSAEERNAVLSATSSPHFGHDFSRIPVRPPTVGGIQTKLAINKPGDEYEQEADHVAEQVLRMPEPQLQQNACPCGGGCPKCQTVQPSQESVFLPTKRLQVGNKGKTQAPPIVHEALTGSGQPLDSSVRRFMEPRFGHDISQVRIHAGGVAEQSTRVLNARAYAAGNNVVFGVNQFAPDAREGKSLLAHELTHVVQQGAAPQLLRPAASATSSVATTVLHHSVPRLAKQDDTTQRQRFIDACSECTPKVVRAFAHMTSYMQHVSDAYTNAWQSHLDVLEDQGASNALLTEFVVSALLAFMAGATGGGVAMIVTKATAGDIISDGIKDMAKAGVKNATSHIPRPAGLRPVSMNPRDFSRGQGDYMRSQVEYASQQIERWIHGARTQDPNFDMNFDPVAVTTSSLHLDDGTDMLTAPLPDVNTVAAQFELGFWKEWLIHKAWTVVGAPSRWGMFYHATENQGKDVRNRIDALGQDGDAWLERYGSRAKRAAEAEARRMNEARHE